MIAINNKNNKYYEIKNKIVIEIVIIMRGIAVSPIISKIFEYCCWTNSSHYSPHQIISLVSKRTRVAEMQFTLFERLLIAMSHAVQLLTSARLIYLRLLIKLTIMPYLSN